MIQSILLLLAPSQAASDDLLDPSEKSYCQLMHMATRRQSVPRNQWKRAIRETIAITANALGFLLFLAGIGLSLRLMEVLFS